MIYLKSTQSPNPCSLITYNLFPKIPKTHPHFKSLLTPLKRRSFEYRKKRGETNRIKCRFMLPTLLRVVPQQQNKQAKMGRLPLSIGHSFQNSYLFVWNFFAQNPPKTKMDSCQANYAKCPHGRPNWRRRGKEWEMEKWLQNFVFSSCFDTTRQLKRGFLNFLGRMLRVRTKVFLK